MSAHELPIKDFVSRACRWVPECQLSGRRNGKFGLLMNSFARQPPSVVASPSPSAARRLQVAISTAQPYDSSWTVGSGDRRRRGNLSILARLLDVVDDQGIDRALLLFQFEAEVFLQGRPERGNIGL
jgi:hypothetical protein